MMSTDRIYLGQKDNLKGIGAKDFTKLLVDYMQTCFAFPEEEVIT